MAQNKATTTEIAAYALGFAEASEARRVAGWAVVDKGVREQVQALEAAQNTPIEAPTEADYKSLEARLREATLGAAAESPIETLANTEPLTQGSGGVWRATDALVEAVLKGGELALNGVRLLLHTLTTGAQPVDLPCFAPATASAAPEMEVRRSVMTTAEGVRVEFQQLPMSTRLRVVVDASQISSNEGSSVGYNAVFVTLEDSGGQRGASSPDRHILVVSLNGAGRGYTDFTVSGGLPSAHTYPAPHNGCRLLGVTLSYVPPAASGSGF